MPDFLNVKALVLREVQYKEADRILTLYTHESGKMSVKARRALRNSSRIAAVTQQLTYAELTLFENRGKYTVNEGTIIESFTGLRNNFENFALGCYFAECVEALTQEEIPDEQMLQLVLNALYALSNNMYPPEHIKAVFEIRLMSLLGYKPDLDECCICGEKEPNEPCLSIETGHVCCKKCRNQEMGSTLNLCNESLNAIRFAVDAPPKRIFNRIVNGDARKKMCIACENYLINFSERNYSTLDYWKKIRMLY